MALCRDLGLGTPETKVVTSRADLREAVGRFDQFVARPAFSRGGTVYLTNPGPRAGERRHRLLHELLTTPDAFMSPHDILPALFVLISRHHWHSVARREHIGFAPAYVGDVSWDGLPLPELPAGAVASP